MDFRSNEKNTLESLLNNQGVEKAMDSIATIRNSNELAKKTLGSLLNEKTLQHFDRIEDATMNLQTIFDQVNKVRARPTTSKSSLQMSKFSLLEILKYSVPRKTPSSITINFPEHDVQIEGYRYKLIVLFSNLIENSIQAMDDKGTIHITAFDSDNMIIIQVGDTGPGIPESVLDRLFDSLTTTKKHGSGLGTKMAKSIVDLHGGEISVSNNPTTFTIKLPKPHSI